MKSNRWLLPPIFVVALLACGTLGDQLVPRRRETATRAPQIITPVPSAEGQLQPLATGHIARVWANTGGDKVTRDELRATVDPSAVINSVWDGQRISLFGAKNEVISFNLVLEAPTLAAEGVEVDLTSLEGPEGAALGSWPSGSEDLFQFVGREVELFYVRYLEIKGISTDLFFAGYDYDERHLPSRCRRPHDEEEQGRGRWDDRPCANLFYPEIAVPLELHTPFQIPAGSNQTIWGDIYIPKSMPSGLYAGQLSVLEEGQLVWEIPVELTVHDFTLPDLPAARTMLYLSEENLAARYVGTGLPEGGTDAHDELQLLIDRHFQLAHRHKISLFDSYTPVGRMDDYWLPRLDGSLFRPENGYDGVGVGVGNNLYAIGAYGGWPWSDGTERAMWENTDAWIAWFEDQELSTPTDFFLYLIDVPIAAEFTPSLDIPTSWASFGISQEWEAGVERYTSAGDKAFYMYNSNRPATGSFAIEDEGTALRELPWGQYKKGVDRWLYWESTYYDNYQCDGESSGSQTNVFRQAQTYGCLEEFDEVFGETGWNYLNGDGVLFYPGTDERFPEDSYGVMGPFVSLRLKQWRRGVQDVDYLTLARAADPEATAEIVDQMVPKVLWELGVEEPEDPTYVLTDSSWPADPDEWERARAELAAIILGSAEAP